MRVLALLFFFFTTPLVIFLATIAYGGISTKVIKEEVSKSGLYKKLEFPPLTPAYVKAKVEKAVDDSALWITGKSKEEPVISFRDLKDKFLAQNPEMQDTFSEMENMPEADESMDSFGQEEEADPQAFMKDLAKNDFTYPLKDVLSGLKFVNLIISVLLPVLVILMVLSILLIVHKSPDAKSKFRWVGITFLLSALGGFITFLGFQLIVRAALGLITQNANEAIYMVYPIVERIALLFVTRNGEIQILFSFAIGVFGVVCFASSFAFGKELASKPRPKQRKTT